MDDVDSEESVALWLASLPALSECIRAYIAAQSFTDPDVWLELSVLRGMILSTTTPPPSNLSKRLEKPPKPPSFAQALLISSPKPYSHETLTKLLSAIWPSQFCTQTLARLDSKDDPDPSPKTLNRSRRVSTNKAEVLRVPLMQAILDQLHGSSLVQVRGTPGSGKTTLMHHLNNFILDQYPEATIVRFWSWEKPSALIPYNDSTRTIQRFETQQTPGGALKWDELTSPALSRTYLLFDDAQNTNFDHFLWGELFKTVPSNVHILLLCSYGSTWKYDPTDPNSVHGTLFEIPPTQLVGLRPTPQVKHHLLFSQKDYNQIILHRSHSSSNHHISLNQALHDRIFSVCEGHIGAMSAYLGIVYAAAVTMKVETGATFSEEEFDSHQQSPYIFHQTFSNSHHTFTRGLPRPMDLIRKPDLVDALQMLLATGQLVFFNTSSTDVFLVAVTEAHLRGWVNMEKTMLPGRGLMTVATFPSSLHRAHISWMLADPHQLPDHLQTISLDGYVTLVVERFSVAALSRQDIYVPGSGPGSGVTNLGEAHWQNEFYRAALTIFPGVVMWPEYDSNRPGRIDFFVPARKWGIELLRDEHDIKEHNDRFSPGGRYHMWLQSAQIVDWIVVDFRTTNIEKSQPLMPNLVHYVFTKDFRRWDKFNNMLERITQGASLTTSTLRDLQYRL